MTELEDDYLECSYENCGTKDGTVVGCDQCGSLVCLEHDDVLENRGIDSGLTLCISCGEEFDKEHGVKYDSHGNLKAINDLELIAFQHVP